MKVGIVAGEKSGDLLGAELIKAIKIRYPDAQFVGLAGPLMQSEGARSLADMDKISIMGVAGVVKGLREILRIRRTIRQHMLDWRPDVFIGIDVPDFNLGLELSLKRAGIPTVHYVSPTVWAWRGKRIKKIRRAVDLMLTLFPFEETFYQEKQVPVKYVGHPLARSILRWKVPDELKSEIVSGESGKRLIAVLPGSRMSEVSRLAPIMLASCNQLSKAFSNLEFVLPASNESLYSFLQHRIAEMHAPVKLILGHSRDVLALSHLAVLASGTAALEAGLFAKPMVVMYKVAKLEEWYAARTMEVSHFSMPNHLTDSPVVPELIQANANVENLVAEVSHLLEDAQHYEGMRVALAKIAPTLDEDSGALACAAIEALLQERRAAC